MNIENQQITDPAIQKKLIILIVSNAFFVVLNNTMFNVSLPDIAQQFHLLPSQLSWVVSGFVIFLAIGSITYGRLADLYSIKKLFFIGLLLFNAGSLIGFLSQWYPMLLIGRVTQAVGCGAMPALGMIIATKYFPYEMKGRVLGLITSTVAFGIGIGPVVGGFIAGTLHWRFLFIISMISMSTLPLSWRYLPDHKGTGAKFDISGAILMTGSISSLLAFITLTLWWILPISVILFVWFLVHIQKVDIPFLSPSMFRNRPYRNLNIAVFVFAGLSYSVSFMTPLLLRAIYNLGAMNIGLIMFPGAMMGAIAGVIGGRSIGRVGSMTIVYTSMVLLVAGFLFLSTFAGMNPWIIVLSLSVCFTGSALFQVSSSHKVSSTLAMEHQGIGMGMYNLIFFASGAISAATIGKVLDLTRDHTPINVFNYSAHAGPYSNLCLLMAIMGLCTVIILYLSFRGRSIHNENG